MLLKTTASRCLTAGVLLAAGLTMQTLAQADHGNDRLLRAIFDRGHRLTTKVEFQGLLSNANNACAPNCPIPAPDPVVGKRNFGLTADSTAIDNSQALFQGSSQMLGVGNIPSNGRACSTCHRPDLRNGSGVVIEELKLGLPHSFPLTNTVPLTDTLFTGREADDGNHPQAFDNLNNHGLVAIKPGRFNPLIAWNDPYREVLLWRKVPRFVNTALTIGFLNDGRMRELGETTRGAIFSHTQNFDERFDDLLRAPNPRFPMGPPEFEERPRNIAAFIETMTVEPPALRAFLNPADPTLNPQCSNAPGAACKPSDCLRLTGGPTCDLYTVLTRDPFFTVPVQTAAQRRGRDVFQAQCMSCHNTPNVFGSIDHVPGNPLQFPPRIGKAFDVGVAQRNVNSLDFRAFVCTTQPVQGVGCPTKVLKRIVLPLAKMDGTTVYHEVTIDPGTASATGRYEDLFRFKVPQLRRVKQLGPYFHDNSAATLEAVIDHFESDHYKRSADGRNNPIQLNPAQRADLLEFLNIL